MDGAGPSALVVKEDSVGFSIIDVRDRHAGPSGLGDLEVLDCNACAHLVQYQAPTICRPGNSRNSVTNSHLLTIFITSNQLRLHVHAVFYYVIYFVLPASGERHNAHMLFLDIFICKKKHFLYENVLYFQFLFRANDVLSEYFLHWQNMLDDLAILCILLIIPFRIADSDVQWVFAALTFMFHGLRNFKYAIMFK